MPRLTLSQPEPGTPTVNLWFLRRELGQQQLTIGRMAAYVQALVDKQGFPKPLPSFSQRKGLTLEVTDKSVWRREAVEAWLGGFLPPALADAIDAAAMAAAAASMDQRASALGLKIVQGGRK